MVKWYDRIGNTIEMRIGSDWIKGIVVYGDRTGDGIINMETEDRQKYWCGVGGEYIHFRKCEDSLGDLITNADRIRAMSDEELAENTVQYDYELCRYICGDGEEFYLRSNAIEHQLEWLKSPIE